MVIYYIFAGFCFICVAAFAFLAWQSIAQLEKQRAEWNEERSKLLDRIQSGGLSEFKAQERADTPIKRIEKSPVIKQLEKERWL